MKWNSRDQPIGTLFYLDHKGRHGNGQDFQRRKKVRRISAPKMMENLPFIHTAVCTLTCAILKIIKLKMDKITTQNGRFNLGHSVTSYSNFDRISVCCRWKRDFGFVWTLGCLGCWEFFVFRLRLWNDSFSKWVISEGFPIWFIIFPFWQIILFKILK